MTAIHEFFLTASTATPEPTRDHLFKHCPEWKNQQKVLWNTVLTETRKLPGPTRERHKTSIAELLADQRCSQAALDFLETTDVGRTSGPPVAEEADEEASVGGDREGGEVG